MSTRNWTLSAYNWNASPTQEPPLEGKLLSEALDLGYSPGEVFLLNRPVQCVVIGVIIITAVVCNILVIHNIWMCQLKMRTVNFLLIKNLCIVDLIGACVVLPVPLLATAKGVWDFGAAMCKANSTVNITLWFQHILMFAMLKIDRVLASCLPFGKYPIFSVEVVTVIVLASWGVSFFVAGLVTAVFNSSYEPAVVLCIPELPVEFFITIFSIYCAALLAMVVGYILVICHLKKKRAQIRSHQGVEVADYSGLERSALTSFLITISHFLMYVPTMLVIGLHGWFLHPIAILICDMVVYAEFSIHPIVLLCTSTKMRKEIMHTIKICIQDVSAIWKTEFPRCMKKKGLVYAMPPSERNNPDSFVESVNMGSNNLHTAIQVTSQPLQRANPEFSTPDNLSVVDVVFHRTESPERRASKQINREISKSRSSIRANGRSISRDDCTLKNQPSQTGQAVTLCRRHASLPIMHGNRSEQQDSSFDKRHSIALPSETSFQFLTSSFLSYLLSIGAGKKSDKDVRQSTEIVYEFREAEDLSMDQDEVVSAVLLSEPALYRLKLESLQSSAKVQTTSMDSSDSDSLRCENGSVLPSINCETDIIRSNEIFI